MSWSIWCESHSYYWFPFIQKYTGVEKRSFGLRLCSSLLFYYAWRHSFCFRDVRGEFLFNPAASGLWNLLFSGVFLSNFEAVNKASCGCVDLIQLFLIYWCFFPIFNLGFNEVVQWRALDGKGIEIEACKASPPSGDEAEVFLTKVSQTRGALTPQLFPHELLWTFQHILRQNQSAFRQSWREMEVKQAEMFSIGDVITRARRFTDRWHQGSSVNFLFNQLPVVQSMVIMCIPLI